MPKIEQWKGTNSETKKDNLVEIWLEQDLLYLWFSIEGNKNISSWYGPFTKEEIEEQIKSINQQYENLETDSNLVAFKVLQLFAFIQKAFIEKKSSMSYKQKPWLLSSYLVTPYENLCDIILAETIKSYLL